MLPTYYKPISDLIFEVKAHVSVWLSFFNLYSLFFFFFFDKGTENVYCSFFYIYGKNMEIVYLQSGLEEFSSNPLRGK
jgi:hypothetical protein